MTAYFDNMTERLVQIQEGLQKDGFRAMNLLRHWERLLVNDVLVATQLGLPEEIVAQIHKVILKHGVESLPPDIKPLELETFQEHLHHMDRLVFDLHTVFHNLARNHGQSDSPRAPLRGLLSRAEEALAGATPPDRLVSCMVCWDHGGFDEECSECGIRQE